MNKNLFCSLKICIVFRIKLAAFQSRQQVHIKQFITLTIGQIQNIVRSITWDFRLAKYYLPTRPIPNLEIPHGQAKAGRWELFAFPRCVNPAGTSCQCVPRAQIILLRRAHHYNWLLTSGDKYFRVGGNVTILLQTQRPEQQRRQVAAHQLPADRTASSFISMCFLSLRVLHWFLRGLSFPPQGRTIFV